MNTTWKISLMISALSGLLVSGCRTKDDQPTSTSQATPVTPAAGTVAQTPTTQGPTANFNGVYQGSIVNTNGNPVNATLTLTQSGSSVAGTYATPTSNGNVTGTVNGNTLSFNLAPAGQNACSGTASGTATQNGNTITFSSTVSGLSAANAVGTANTNPLLTPLPTTGAPTVTTPIAGGIGAALPGVGTVGGATTNGCIGPISGQGSFVRLAGSGNVQVLVTP